MATTNSASTTILTCDVEHKHHKGVHEMLITYKNGTKMIMQTTYPSRKSQLTIIKPCGEVLGLDLTYCSIDTFMALQEQCQIYDNRLSE